MGDLGKGVGNQGILGLGSPTYCRENGCVCESDCSKGMGNCWHRARVGNGWRNGISDLISCKKDNMEVWVTVWGMRII
jgi:hypothetical protein